MTDEPRAERGRGARELLTRIIYLNYLSYGKEHY